MFELLIAGGLVAMLLAAGAATFLSWSLLLQTGVWLCAAGLLLGVPTGFVYHVLLYRTLAPRGELPRGWIWKPLDQHDKLRPGERRRVLPWAGVGAAGFGVIMLGFLSMAMSVVSVMTRGV